MTTRLETLAGELKLPLLVTNLVNVRYLTGFDSSNAALLVRPKGTARLYTDFRYIETAREVPDVEVVLSKRSLIADLAEKLSGRVQFEADVLPHRQWEQLGSGRVTPVPSAGIVAGLRAVKDDEELAAIGRAARVADRAFEALTAETWIGRSEKELAWRLRELLHAHGADDSSFDAIVACGPNGARPHATPGDTIVEPRSLVVVDWGAVVDGYCSDCTRTLSTGSPPDRLREAYDVCLAAQRRACDTIKAGMTGVEADEVAREPIAAEFGEAFGHGLGHGVGLEVHEAPRLSPESTDVLAAGNIVTIEPGIYLEGLGGVRIEDLAVVRDDGLELLTAFPKELIEVS
ncbi:MAG TPA: Xaa-Pro peptidase family protein [Gaiellaceae bacterium]|nr:Xaa-Pro peptidase family protein [Gaiellaceae bacterium]